MCACMCVVTSCLDGVVPCCLDGVVAIAVLSNPMCACVLSGTALNTFQYLVFDWASSVSKPHVCLCVVRTSFEHLSLFGIWLG